METIQLDTNIHCEKCIDKLKPHFDKEPKVASWKVDLSSEAKTLSVEGNKVTEDLVSNLLDKEGYKITKAESSSGSFCSNTIKWKRASFNTLNCGQ